MRQNYLTGYKWTISFINYRNSFCLNFIPPISTGNLIGLSKISFIQLQSHSPPISGYYKLIWNNYQIYYHGSNSIPYNIQSLDLQIAFRNSTNFT